LENAAPLPIPASIALEVIGSMPGTKYHAASSHYTVLPNGRFLLHGPDGAVY
jgi:hypothetical protein